MQSITYEKPSVVDLGTLRALTRLGAGPDCDGGAFGIAGGPGDGSSTKCFRHS
jgi:hypothetical protein